MNPETILLRQAHPTFMPDDVLTSQVFFPFPKDEGLLSAYDADQITASDSYDHYTTVLKNESHSVWGVTCQEAAAETVPGSPDPSPENPAHAKIDFTAHLGNQKQCRKIAKQLKALAAARGCLFLPAQA